ncbi:hypothetical protein PYCC9005_005125 [Savitreella phatthalungensis]
MSSAKGLVSVGLGLNAILTAYVAYTANQLRQDLTKQQESLDFGMDRIDECLNRIDLRNNETTGYFEKVSKKVEELEKAEKAGKKK